MMFITITEPEEATRILEALLGDDLPRLVEAIENSPETLGTVDQMHVKVCAALTHRPDCWRRIAELLWVAQSRSTEL